MIERNRHPDAIRLEELLIAQTLGDLSTAERAELESLRMRLPALSDGADRPLTGEDVETDLGAILAGLAASGAAPLPGNLRDAIVARGETAVRAGAQNMKPEAETRRSLVGPLGWAGWAVAALAIAVMIWGVDRRHDPAPREQLASLLDARVKDTIRIDMHAQPDPAASDLSGGQVIWNNTLQKGFLKFKGLANNNPTKEQYQLWIFDAGREGGKYPVDGGVFDLASGFTDPATGDVYIPINAKLSVRTPVAFAVTVEEPGGVVVTKKERVVVLAPVPTPPPANAPKP